MSSNSNTDSTPSSATITITYPLETGSQIGWLTKVTGTCSEESSTVTVTIGSASQTSTCSSSAFSLYVDTSSESSGTQTISASIPDSNGIDATATLSVNKFSTNCDSSTNRGRNFASGLSAGSGTKADPWVICTLDQMQDISGQNAHFSIENDLYFDYGDSNGDGTIDGSDTDFQAGSGFSPVNVNGVLFGNKFVIQSLFINRGTTDRVGLIGEMYGAVRDLTFIDPNLTGQDQVGALGGTLQAAYNIHVTNPTISGRNYVSGIAGTSSYAVRMTVSGGTVSGTGMVGGLIGEITGHSSHLVNSSTVTGTGDRVGGIAGLTSYADSCTHCINRGTVSGASYVGGITGQLVWSNAYISYSYNSGGITGSGQYVGGITGEMNGSTVLLNSFSTGEVRGVSASAFVGLLVGHSSGTITNSHSVSDATCNNSSTGGCNTSYTSAASEITDMYSTATAPLSSWDFDAGTADGRSDLWEEQSADFPKLWFETDADNSTTMASFTGDGTSGSPILIASASDFDLIRSNPRLAEMYITITAGLDISDLASFNSAFKYFPFLGTLDGGNNTVTNFSHTETEVGPFGLIATTFGATIQDLSVVSPAITANLSFGSGIFSGISALSDWSNVHVTTGGSINCFTNCGGIIGKGQGATTANKLSNAATVTSTGSVVGGVFADVLGGSTVINVFNTGNVSGTEEVGGVFGKVEGINSSISNSYNSGNVTGTSYNIGGIIGTSYFPQCSNCFSTGTVSGNNGANTVGLAIGIDNAITNAYYHSGASCTNTGAGSCNTRGTAEATLTNLHNSGLAPASAWDFATVWQDNSPAAPTFR